MMDTKAFGMDTVELPHDIPAERALLGSILIDHDAMPRAREVDLAPEDFYNEQHGRIYRAMLELASRYQTIDVLMVCDAMGDEGEQTRSDLYNLMRQTPTSVHAEYYAGIVKRTSQQRRIIRVAAEMTVAAYAHDGPIETLYDAVARPFFQAIDVSERDSHHYGGDAAIMDYLEYLQRLAERDERDAVTTGLADLDGILCEIEPGILHMVVAKSSVGKTTYMEQVAEYNAQGGKRVAYYHYELSSRLMETRRMARWSGVPYNYLRRGRDRYEAQNDEGVMWRCTVAHGIELMREWVGNLVMVHCAGWTAERIAADVQRLHARGECDLAVVDYLQKIPLPAMKGANTSVLLGQNSETLKNVAEMTGIPVVLGSQVRRGDHDSGNKKPSMEDIRNSGEPEEKANQIVVMHRPESRPQGERPEDTHNRLERLEIYVEKNTTGAPGMANVGHLLGRFRLVNWQDE